MQPEGSRRAIGVICTDVALPVDEDGQYVCAVTLRQAMPSREAIPPARVFSEALPRVGRPLVWASAGEPMFNGGPSRGVHPPSV